MTVYVRGKQHEQIVPGSRRDASEHEARMRLRLGSRSPTHGRIVPGFSGFCVTEYNPHAQAHLAADSWRKVRCYQVASLCAFFGDRRLTELQTSEVDAYTAHRKAEISATSVNNELRVLGRILRYAREECGYDVPALRIRKLPQTERRVRVWTLPQVRKLLKVTAREDPSLVPMLLFMLNTGLRKGETIAARWSWVDRRRRLLRVGPSATWRPKNRKPREVPIPAPLWRALERLPREREHVFLSGEGEPFAKFPWHRFARVVGAASLRGSPHTCRHTYASLFLDAGGSLWDLAAVLGHSTTRTTELYAHLLPGHLDRARNLVSVG